MTNQAPVRHPEVSAKPIQAAVIALSGLLQEWSDDHLLNRICTRTNYGNDPGRIGARIKRLSAVGCIVPGDVSTPEQFSFICKFDFYMSFVLTSLSGCFYTSPNPSRPKKRDWGGDG